MSTTFNHFSHSNDEITQSSKVRPLGYMSDFVINDLPSLNSDPLNNLNLLDKIENFLSSDVLNEFLFRTKAGCPNSRVGILDLKMIYCSLVSAQKDNFLEGIAKDKISKIREEYESVLIDILAENAITHMSYEDIILNNPVSDIRVFSSDEIGKSEAQFYLGHVYIEDIMQTVIDKIDEAVNHGFDDLEKSVFCIREAIDLFKDVNTAMRSYAKELPKEHFVSFKKYFDTNTHTNEKGPSGAFSSKVPLLDATIFGSEIDDEMKEYISINHQYFYTPEINQTLEKMQSGNSLALLVENSENEKLQEIYNKLVSKTALFRRTHYGAVIHQIGQEIVGSAEEGSAGEFLTNRIKFTKEMKSKRKMCPYA